MANTAKLEIKKNPLPKVEPTKKTSSSLTPSEKILMSENKKKSKVSLTPSEIILQKERALRVGKPNPSKEDFLSGKAFRRPDVEDGILTNPDEIVLYKCTLTKDLFSNGLLGEYDVEGNYSIPEIIRKELIALNKSCGENFEETYYAISRSEKDHFKTLKFAVDFTTNVDGTRNATLKILEEVQKSAGLFNNTLSTFVADYSEKDSKDFVSDAFEVFNVARVTDAQTNWLDENLAPVTMERKNKLKNIKNKYYLDYSSNEKTLLDNRIRMLQNSGEVGKDCIQNLESAIKQYQNVMPNGKRCREPAIMNSILENIVDTLFGFPLLGDFSHDSDQHICAFENQNLTQGEKEFLHDALCHQKNGENLENQNKLESVPEKTDHTERLRSVVEPDVKSIKLANDVKAQSDQPKQEKPREQSNNDHHM